MTRTPKIAVLMDPVETLHPEKDTTLRLMSKAQDLNWDLYYFTLHDLFLKDGKTYAWSHAIQIFQDTKKWWTLLDSKIRPLNQFDIILMRKDPPVNMEYIYSTFLLEHAEADGSLIVNSPRALRDVNEKLYTTWFSHCMPETLVSASSAAIKDFIEEKNEVILKPLDGMGGQGIFKCQKGDINNTVIIETLTAMGTKFCMAQKFIPEIKFGDKRIFLLDGEPLPFALARIPKEGDLRGNLVRGASGVGQELTERDQWICQQVGSKLRDQGLLLVGLDIIGDYLTEINVTSPTCIRELEHIFKVDLSDQILQTLLKKLEQARKL